MPLRLTDMIFRGRLQLVLFSRFFQFYLPKICRGFDYFFVKSLLSFKLISLDSPIEMPLSLSNFQFHCSTLAVKIEECLDGVMMSWSQVNVVLPLTF